MKLKYISSLLLGAAVVIPSCTPDEYSLGGQTYEKADLVEGVAYSITPDANNPNIIHLEALTSPDCQPLWETPSGRSQNRTMTINLPFAGEYAVVYGVMTPQGPVYGDTCRFTVSQNAFEMLDNPIWTNLCGGVGKSRKWYPMDGNYGIGRCTGPVMYMSPDDVMNNGTGNTDLIFGSANWTPNWDPGFQDWLISSKDPYLASYMTFGLDAKKGCTVDMFRGEAGEYGAGEVTGTSKSGKFVLNVDDEKRPTISFENGTFALHNLNFDDVCNNYTNKIKIIECTPYLLQIATMRTNSEGPWWLVWNFISEEAKNDPSIIPTEDAGLLEKAPVSLPKLENIETNLFKTEINGSMFVGSDMTFLISDETPYDWMWWNAGSSAWETIVNGAYGSTWAPAVGAEVADYELVLSNTADGYKWDDGTSKGLFKIEEGKIKFVDSDGNPAIVKFLTATSDTRTVTVEGSEFTIFDVKPGESVTLGIPTDKDEAGDDNTYLCVNLLYKPIATSNGPIAVAFDAEKLVPYFEVNNNAQQFRFDVYNPWGQNNIVDPAKLKLKKNQKLVIKFKVSGIQWKEGVKTKLAISDNLIVNKWGADVYADATAVEVDPTSGEFTMELVNNTGATANFVDVSCVSVCMLCDNTLADGPLTEDGSFDIEQVTTEVVSIEVHTIQ